MHGVTIGTNAILTGKGADVWMLVTKGFRDVLEIGRTNRPVLYDIRSQKAPPLVPRTRAIEIDERLLYDGSVRAPLRPASVLAALDQLPEGENVALIVCFLHSYADPAHEDAAKAIVKAARPRSVRLHVVSDPAAISRVRAFQHDGAQCQHRPADAALSVALGGRARSPRIPTRSLHHDVERRCRDRGDAPSSFLLRRCSRDPAAGVAAAVHLGSELGVRNLITCDMGGTSTDVCLIENLEDSHHQ